MKSAIECCGTFAKNLCRLMHEKGLNTTRLSKLIDVSDSSVSAWANGYYIPNTPSLAKLTNFFGVTTEYWFTSHTEILQPVESDNSTPIKLHRDITDVEAAAVLCAQAYKKLRTTKDKLNTAITQMEDALVVLRASRDDISALFEIGTNAED